MSLRGPWERHAEAVDRLAASYSAIPAGAPVRLAKRTSNLFRRRSATNAPGLDVGGLDGVIEVDPVTRTAQVQGMCTYEDLVDATLPHGLIPLVVPQLRTITLGGAVSGLGIESTSFRSGLPHESVLEMDVFTGAGEVVTCRPGDELFDAFPNSYGSLGYATRLQIELEAVPSYVSLRHVRFDDASLLAKTVEEIVATGEHAGVRVDGLDGVAFAPGELYLTLAAWTEQPDQTPSDYTGQDVFFRSIQERETDLLTMYDYLWRWDTDWFWCSGAFGLQNPTVRRLWPQRYRRSDAYHRLVALDNRFGIVDRLDRRAGRLLRERVIQDVEVPVDRLAEFLEWFDAEVGMRPVWLCPLRLRDDRTWSTYPLVAGTTYVNVGFWGTVHVGPDALDGPRNRAIESRVHELGGHKSLYSDSYYDRETFDRLYAGARLAGVKSRFDPDDRLTSLYDKGGAAEMSDSRPTIAIGDAVASLLRDGMPMRFTAYDGSSAGPPDADITLELRNQRGLAYLMTAPGDLGLARAYVMGDLVVHGSHPGDPYDAMALILNHTKFRRPTAAELVQLVRGLGLSNLKPPPPPPQEHLPRWRRAMEGLRHSMSRDAEVISHHYDVSNLFYEHVLGPSMTYTCAVYPDVDASLETAQAEKYDLVCRKLDLKPGQRLLDLGCGWGGMVRHAAQHYGVRALGVTLSREQASWAKEAIDREGLGDLAEVRHSDYRDVLESDFDAISSIGLTEHIGIKNYPAYFTFIRDHLRDQGRFLNHSITRPHNRMTDTGAFIDRYVFPDGELIGSGTIIKEAQDAGLEVVHEENLRIHYAMTLRDWSRNLVEHWDDCVAEVGEGTARVWGLYMTSCRLGFERNEIQLHQVLGVRTDASGGTGFPLRPTW